MERQVKTCAGPTTTVAITMLATVMIGLGIPLRLRLFSSRHTPRLVRLTRKNRTRLALLWFSKAACTVRAPGVRSRRPPPPRLSHVFARLDRLSRPRACVFAVNRLEWGCSKGLRRSGGRHTDTPPVSPCGLCLSGLLLGCGVLSSSSFLSRFLCFPCGGKKENNPDDKSAPSRSRPTYGDEA